MEQSKSVEHPIANKRDEEMRKELARRVEQAKQGHDEDIVRGK